MNTSLILFFEYLNDKDNASKYISALEKIISDEIAPRSKGMIYYFLSKIEMNVGKNEKSHYWLSKCQSETPLLFEFFSSQSEFLNINEITLAIKNYVG